MLGFVRSKVSVRPHILDLSVMNVVFKGDLFEFIGRRRTKNWMVLSELHQYWFSFVAMYNTRMPYANVMKKFQ